MKQAFTVLMSVYENDKAEFLTTAIDSIYQDQTLKPNEIILIVDGQISEELIKCIVRLSHNNPNFKPCWLSKNKGLGNAMKVGVELASNELIARMDSDDIALPHRFESQVSFMLEHTNIDIVGGQINEFIDNPNNLVGRRTVPLEHNNIINYTKKRCPFNHMSVMFRKKAVLDVGNYIDWHYNEDYYLWIRMAEAGCQFANLPDTLVNVRVGRDMYARRGGWRYFKSEAKLQGYMLQHKMISLPRYIYNVAGRFVVQVAMPNWLRGFVFQKLFRK